MLLNTAKEAWKDSGKTTIQYILDDATRTFISLSDDFFYEDYDIFVSDSSKELQTLETIKSLYQPAMQNGASLVDIAEIATMDSINEIKLKLSEIEKKRMEQQQTAQDADNQRKAELIQIQNESKQQELQLKQAELDLDKYKIDSDNQTKIYVAELNAYRNNADVDADQNGVPDVMEIADMSIRQIELDANIMDKQLQASQKQRDSEMKSSIEKKKIETSEKIEKIKIDLEHEKIKLEEKKMTIQKQLQIMKDKSAMEREKLKAKTSLANKTTGEKK